MTEQTITTKKGQITLTSDGLEIIDDAIFNRNLIIGSSLVWCFYGILNIIRYVGAADAEKNFFYFYLGVFILALWVVVMGFVLFRVSFRQNYDFSELKEVRFRQGKKGEYHARLVTQKGRIRTLTLNEKKGDVDKIIRQLKKRKIKVEWKKDK